jgi:hypothetical protein
MGGIVRYWRVRDCARRQAGIRPDVRRIVETRLDPLGHAQALGAACLSRKNLEVPITRRMLGPRCARQAHL